MNARAKPIFDHALGLASREERSAYIREVCGADEALRQEVESLVDAFDRAGSFLQTAPPLTVQEEATSPAVIGSAFGDY